MGKISVSITQSIFDILLKRHLHLAAGIFVHCITNPFVMQTLTPFTHW